MFLNLILAATYVPTELSSEELGEFLKCHVSIAEDCTEKTRADNFTGMNRYACRSAVRMFQENMAAADSVDLKSGLLESTNDLLAL